MSSRDHGPGQQRWAAWLSLGTHRIRVAGMNPFIFHRPLVPSEMVLRATEAVQVLELAIAGQATRVSAPRRYGKTSLLNEVIAEAEETDLGTVYVDFSGVADVIDAAVRIEASYQEGLRGKLRRRAGEIAEAMNASAGVKLGPVAVSARPADSHSELRRLYRLLDLPERIFDRTGHRSLVILDEFQDLLRAAPNLDGVLRSRIQHHRDSASYLFAGSHPGMMAALFGNRERPLYGQARPVVLGRIAEPELADYIKARLRSARNVDDSVVDQLVELAHGHPQRTLLLAHHLYERARDDGLRSAALVVDVAQATLRDLDDGFRLLWDDVTPDQKALLRDLALQTSIPAADVTSSGAQAQAERTLSGLGDVLREDGRVLLADPLLGMWIRDRVADRPVARASGTPPGLQEGDLVVHRGLGLGRIVEVDPGEGFGEQREYLTCEWKSGLRSAVPRELVTKSPLRQLLLKADDLPVVAEQLVDPYVPLEVGNDGERLERPLAELQRLGQICLTTLDGTTLTGPVRNELQGLVTVLSVDVAIASGSSQDVARRKLYGWVLTGAGLVLRAEAAEVVVGGRRAMEVFKELTQDDVWFPSATWYAFHGSEDTRDFGRLFPRQDRPDQQNFSAALIEGLFWLVASQDSCVRLVGLFRSAAAIRAHVTALRNLEQMRQDSFAGNDWEGERFRST